MDKESARKMNALSQARIMRYPRRLLK